ncbi:hypothetical protein HUJ05_001615 [Dendroctonus ponderosae]|nr:hypothetical protein HUJ05_001615 [Dendroctonus ponderosae]
MFDARAGFIREVMNIIAMIHARTGMFLIFLITKLEHIQWTLKWPISYFSLKNQLTTTYTSVASGQIGGFSYNLLQYIE